MIWFYIILVSIGLLCIFSVEHRSQENILQNIVGLKKKLFKATFIHWHFCSNGNFYYYLQIVNFLLQLQTLSYAFGITVNDGNICCWQRYQWLKIMDTTGFL